MIKSENFRDMEKEEKSWSIGRDTITAIYKAVIVSFILVGGLLWVTKKLENESGMRAELKADELKEAIDKKLDNSLFNNHYHEGLKRKVIVEIPEGDANETNSESVQKVDNKRRNKVPDKPLEKQK